MILLWLFWPPLLYLHEKAGHTLHCPKTPRVHFDGSLIPRGALWRLQNSKGEKLIANLPHRVLEPLKCAPRNYGAFEVRPAEFWSNATCAPLSHGDIVTMAKIPKKSFKTWICLIFLKAFFLNHNCFRDLYNQYDNFLWKKYISREGTFHKYNAQTPGTWRHFSLFFPLLNN